MANPTPTSQDINAFIKIASSMGPVQIPSTGGSFGGDVKYGYTGPMRPIRKKRPSRRPMSPQYGSVTVGNATSRDIVPPGRNRKFYPAPKSKKKRGAFQEVLSSMRLTPGVDSRMRRFG